MLDRIRQTPGMVLDRRTYHEQMRVETEQLTGITWKLERSQFFTEAGDDPAWQAFVAGDWHRSLTVFESERADLQAEAAKYARQSSEFRRLRIVEHPVSPYVHWEMQSLRIIDECGMPIRVLDAHEVRDLEIIHPLPEVVIVGQRVLFEVRYDDRWAACGARRIDDPEVIQEASAEIAGLWANAEPLVGYFNREIVPLPDPAG
ncbi:MAG TPA: hypothetical protein VMV92_24495 [Streptosporangiaceae bacterium]|nr:hypothetical protein [Streptosporangiaceae bacterium]